MSVYTTADEERDRAVDGVRTAIDSLSKVVIERCWGYEDYTPEYRAKLRESLSDLLEIRQRFD